MTSTGSWVLPPTPGTVSCPFLLDHCTFLWATPLSFLMKQLQSLPCAHPVFAPIASGGIFLVSHQTCIIRVLLMSLSLSGSCFWESCARTRELWKYCFYSCSICPIRHGSLEAIPTAFAVPSLKSVGLFPLINVHFLGFYSTNTINHVWCHPPLLLNCWCTPLVFQHYWKRAYDSTRLIQQDFGLHKKIL